MIRHGRADRMLLLTLLTGAILCLAGGCSKKLVVAQMPPFWTPDLKVIAVIPFQNHTGTRNAGKAVSQQLAGAMIENGTYTVYDRNQVEKLMAERDWQIYQGDADAMAARLQGKADALLLGSVNTYSAASANPEWRVTQVTYTDANGNPYTQPERWLYEHNEGVVAVTAQLVKIHSGDASGGRVYGQPLYGTGEVFGRAVSESNPPPQYTKPQMDAATCLASARSQAVAQLVEKFAVVTKEIKVEKDSLKTAGKNALGQWEKQDKFAQGRPVHIVLKLPPAADRNIFRIAVMDKDEQQVFFDEKNFTYSAGSLAGQSLTVNEPLPCGDYKVLLFSRFQEKAALDCKFEVQPQGEEDDD